MLILPLIIYLINLRNQKFSKTQTSYFLVLIFTSIIYFVKNLIISGCLIFPISQTCINYLPWTNTENVQNFSQSVMGGNNAIRFNQNFISWFDNWINSAYNYQIYLNLFTSLVIIWIFNKIMFKKNTNNYSKNEKISFLLISLIVFSFFITGPTLRYGFGVFLILISSFSIKSKIPKNENYFKKVVYIISVILFLSVGLTPRIYSYKEFFAQPLALTEINDNTEEYLNSGTLENLKVQNIEGSICYISKTCVKNENYKSLVYLDFLSINCINSIYIYKKFIRKVLEKKWMIKKILV